MDNTQNILKIILAVVFLLFAAMKIIGFKPMKGVFRDLSIDGETLHKALEHIQVCRSFISDNVFPFLNQYDTVQENAD